MGLTALHAAVVLLAGPACGLSAGARAGRKCQDPSGLTPLHLAATERAPLELVELLLGRGADPNVADNDGRSALFYAASQGRYDVTRRLVE